LKYLPYLALIIAILYIVFLRECTGIKDDEMIISKALWGEVKALADKPPEVKIDTLIQTGETVYVDRPVPIPVPDPQDTTILAYSDTLSNDSINAWIDFRLRGELLSLRWGYVPLITNIVKETTLYVPQIVDREVPVPSRGIYLSGLAGYGNTFTLGASMDLITKKDNLYGLQYQRIGDHNFYSLRVGAKIFK